MLVALSVEKKTPEIAPSPWDFVTQPEEDQATAIATMHKKLVKIVHVVPEISSWTDRHTDIFIPVLRNRSHRQSNDVLKLKDL